MAIWYLHQGCQLNVTLNSLVFLWEPVWHGVRINQFGTSYQPFKSNVSATLYSWCPWFVNSVHWKDFLRANRTWQKELDFYWNQIMIMGNLNRSQWYLVKGARLLSKSDYDHGNFEPQPIVPSGRSQTSVGISRRSNIARKAFHAEARLTQPLEPETVYYT